MTEISKSQVSYEDIMWFGVDDNGEIAQFTSGVYGNIPSIVCQSRECLEKITDFFLDDLKKSTEGKKNSNVFRYVNLMNNQTETQDSYLKPSLEISQKGLYSFDSYDREAKKGRYFKVSSPIHPIKISNLPKDICNIVRKVHLKGLSFKEAELLTIEKYIEICEWWIED